MERMRIVEAHETLFCAANLRLTGRGNVGDLGATGKAFPTVLGGTSALAQNCAALSMTLYSRELMLLKLNDLAPPYGILAIFY
jgi:hypothetical protein